jgi:GxxExxY protein
VISKIEIERIGKLIVDATYEVQLVTYLKLSGLKLGYLINFNVPLIKVGIRRKINGYF